jgi:hypothetical protein
MRTPVVLCATLLLAAGMLAASTDLVPFSSASFTRSSGGGVNRFIAPTDWLAPSVTAAVLSPTIASLPVGAPGFLRQTGTYRVYASVSDVNSGIATVSADLSAESGAGAASVGLTGGSYTLAGVSYNYASAQQTASNLLTAGSKAFAVIATDNASNSGSTGFSVSVDNTAPAGSDVQAQNGIGTSGRPDGGDNIIYTFSEPIVPGSVLAGWAGASTNVVVRFTNGAQNDTFAIWNAANTTQLPLGSVSGSKKLVGAAITFGATGTPSTMVMSGSIITVTLGTASGTASTDNGSTLVWTPASGPTDRATNPLSVTPVTESGAPLVNF